MNNAKIEISVIVPSYNPDLDMLTECLKAIQSSDLKPLEIILVDDGSSIDYAEKIKPYCRVIKNEKNMGPAYARNVGAKQSKGNILFFIDSDVKIEKATLTKIAEKFQDADIAAVQTIYSEFTPARSFLSRYQNLYEHYNFMTIKEEYLCTLAAYAVAIKKDIFLELGGFAEIVKNATVEDERLGVALYSEGEKILLAKDIKVEHLVSYNLKSLIRRMFVMGRDWVEYSWGYRKLKIIKFSKTHHHLNLIVSILLSPIFLFSLLAIMFPFARMLAALATLLFLLINAGFLFFILKSEGLIFMIKSIITYYFVCLSAFFGCVNGGLNYLKTRQK